MAGNPWRRTWCRLRCDSTGWHARADYRWHAGFFSRRIGWDYPGLIKYDEGLTQFHDTLLRVEAGGSSRGMTNTIREKLPMKSIAGMSIIITGGGSGIGRDCARRFCERGARVTIGGRRLDKLEAVQAELGAHVRSFRATSPFRLIAK